MNDKKEQKLTYSTQEHQQELVVSHHKACQIQANSENSNCSVTLAISETAYQLLCHSSGEF